jgi:hypothetical protein
MQYMRHVARCFVYIRPLGLSGDVLFVLDACQCGQCPNDTMVVEYVSGGDKYILISSGGVVVGSAFVRPQFFSSALAWACVVYQKICRHQVYMGAYCPEPRGLQSRGRERGAWPAWSVLLHVCFHLASTGAAPVCQLTVGFCFQIPLTTLFCLQLLNPGLFNEASTGGQEAVGWDGQLGGNPTWPFSSTVLTFCGCHAAGNEVKRERAWLASAGWTASAAAAFTVPAAWFTVS